MCRHSEEKMEDRLIEGAWQGCGRNEHARTGVWSTCHDSWDLCGSKTGCFPEAGIKRHMLMVDMGNECDVTDVRQEGDLARKSGSGGCVTDKGRQRVALVENTKEHTRNKTNSALCKRDGPGSRRCVDNVQLMVGPLGRWGNGGRNKAHRPPAGYSRY